MICIKSSIVKEYCRYLFFEFSTIKHQEKTRIFRMQLGKNAKTMNNHFSDWFWHWCCKILTIVLTVSKVCDTLQVIQAIGLGNLEEFFRCSTDQKRRMLQKILLRKNGKLQNHQNHPHSTIVYLSVPYKLREFAKDPQAKNPTGINHPRVPHRPMQQGFPERPGGHRAPQTSADLEVVRHMPRSIR